jgi:hypothetical protein
VRGKPGDAAAAGDPTGLNGRPKCLRYAWPDPARLLTEVIPR